ncbi:hypothetical protein QTP88_007929 [Uroleucon formosanum]
MYVDLGCQGRISDGGVFKNTKLYKKLENHTLNIPNPCALQIPYVVRVPYMILGDKAFALNDYTMTPFAGNPDSGSPERVFNYRHSRARRVVENAFGILSAVFRVLRKPMLLQPDVAAKVTMTTIYLHNFLRSHASSEIYTPPGSLDTEKEGEVVNGRWRSDQQMTSMLPIRNVPRRTSEHPSSDENKGISAASLEVFKFWLKLWQSSCIRGNKLNKSCFFWGLIGKGLL